MHVITFYSFKGGVGRTMALANVAHALARRGRRVLVVDFDLEAPGLSTYVKLPGAPLGLVDYVSDYLENLVARDASKYMARVPLNPPADGELWMVPAGQDDQSYARRLQNIDWRTLYEELDGYLLFEELKSQWQEKLDPDYVLIDSRTGHTDVGGICTRQLPDSVALFYFPNEQNLEGVRRVARDIRDHSKGTPPQIHGVMSNVPMLDDEEGILENWREQFADALDERERVTVHRYGSLQRLNQDLFVERRPKARLSKEYGKLADVLIRGNPQDREGALARLKDFKQYRWEMPYPGRGREIETIARSHPEDADVVFTVGEAWEALGATEEAKIAFASALALGHRTPESLLKQVELQRDENSPEAFDLLSEILRADDVPYPVLQRTVDILQRTEKLDERMAESPALLAAGSSVDAILLRSRVGQRILLHNSEQQFEDEDPMVSALCLIGLGRFDSAMEALAKNRVLALNSDIDVQFNYAVAEWGAKGEIPVDFMEEVVDASVEFDVGANFHQCLALAHWALEDLDHATEHIDKATKALEGSVYVFSCWTYLERKADEFSNDLMEMRTSIEKGATPAPPFLISKEH